MNRTTLSRSLLGLLILSTSFTSSYTQDKQASRRPNIVFMMSDDHAYQAISAYGFGLNKTPHILSLIHI